MKKREKSQQPLRSIDEFNRRFLPRSFAKKKASNDPKELGLIMAREALEKLKPILNGIK